MNFLLPFFFLLLAISSRLCFYGRLALTNCLISGRRFPLIQSGGMRHFGQRGHGFWISGPRAREAGVLVRLWIGVFFLVIRLAGDEDERKSKAQNSFFICIRKRSKDLHGEKKYNENSYGNPF